MKKVGIITIIDNNNYGNRLQNYALSKYCNDYLSVETYTLENHDYLNNRKFLLLRMLKHFCRKLLKKDIKVISQERNKNFILFDNNIKKYKKKINAYTKLDYFDFLIVGSDQVWNPFFRRLRDVDVLRYVKISKKISYAASFGVKSIPKKYENRIINDISNFDYVSVREQSAKDLLEKYITKNINVLIDPTMLLKKEEWDIVAKKPDNYKNEKYILCYFLGVLSEKRKKEINRIATNNDCKIINILNINDPYYTCGPSEFLWLEKNAFLVCTDSFHASVFAIIYDRPFIVFDREGNSVNNMNSRIETLLEKFDLVDRKYNGKIIEDSQLKHNYENAYRILDIERKKSESFLKEALKISTSEGKYDK